jgi:2-oxoisovalerate dehydrogenase E1 component
VPGLKIVYPSNPADAKGLLLSALADPNPVLFFEHKGLYRSLKGDVPTGYYTIPLGEAKVVHEGSDLSIITYGSGVHWATALLEDGDFIEAMSSASSNETGPSIEILDLRSLAPLDYDAIRATVKKTSKVILLHEDTMTGGIGGEVSAWINEHCFEDLDGPVRRVASLDTPIPFAVELEAQFLPKERLKTAVLELLAY